MWREKSNPRGWRLSLLQVKKTRGEKFQKTSWEGAAVFGFLGFRFFVMFQNCPPLLFELKTTIYRQNVARFFNLVPQLLSFL